MSENGSLLDLASEYHKELPERIRRYLNNKRGISDALIDRHLLGWSGWRITIPIFNRARELAFFKLAKDPEDNSESLKMLATPGSSADLYGWERVLAKPDQIIICEGEFDRLVLEAQGFPAVTSTGGAKTFRLEWGKAFEAIPQVYVCFDRDESGRVGALRVGRMIPHARLVELPEDVGESGDVTDFFVRLGRTAEDFQRLLEKAQLVPPSSDPVHPTSSANRHRSPPQDARIARIKQDLPVAEIIGQYVPLCPSGRNLVGRCPFHEDEHPSFTVFPATATFHCFGCGKNGDVITFIREIERLSFTQALEALDRLRTSYGSQPQGHR